MSPTTLPHDSSFSATDAANSHPLRDDINADIANNNNLNNHYPVAKSNISFGDSDTAPRQEAVSSGKVNIVEDSPTTGTALGSKSARRRNIRTRRSSLSAKTEPTHTPPNIASTSNPARTIASWLSPSRHTTRASIDTKLSTNSISSKSSSSSSSISSNSSSSSSLSWPNWRFWKSSSSITDDFSNASEYCPPDPEFTLLLPNLRDNNNNLNNNLNNPNMRETPHPYAFYRDDPSADPFIHHSQSPQSPFTRQVFDTFTSQTVDSVLDRLSDFWKQREQLDSLEGDIGSGAGPYAGASWWLDVLCPSVADMRAIKKILPLHPLTVEDIIHQETREKVDVFPRLGYYFIAFRALDESYFRYTEKFNFPPSSKNKSNQQNNYSANDTSTTTQDQQPTKDSSPNDEKIYLDGGPTFASTTSLAPTTSTRHKNDLNARRTKTLSIVEGDKEGVEGVGVGATNVYLVVFPDGIISFHFEDISKHIHHVQDRLRQFGLARSLSSHWMAYDLMDSIVDTFVPIIDFIETESRQINTMLADPFSAMLETKEAAEKEKQLKKMQLASQSNQTKKKKKFLDEYSWLDGIYPGIRSKNKTSFWSIPLRPLSSATTSSNKPIPDGFANKKIRFSPDPAYASNGILKRTVYSLLPDIFRPDSTLNHRHPQYPHLPKSTGGGQLGAVKAFTDLLKTPNSPFTQRRQMLARIAGTRKLVAAMSRLLGPKVDVVRGMRKRMREERIDMGGLSLGTCTSDRHDIYIYFGDLYDHLVTMQKTLTFYEATLGNDHPSYTTLLRLSMEAVKSSYDESIIRIACIMGTLIPMNLFIGLFSMNIRVAHDSRVEGYAHNTSLVWWCSNLIGALAIVTCMFTLMYTIFKSNRKRMAKRLSPSAM